MQIGQSHFRTKNQDVLLFPTASISFHQHHVATTHVYLAHWSMAEQQKHAKSTLHSQLSHCNHNADRAKKPGILIDSLAGRQPWGSTMIFTTLLKLLL